MMQALFLSGAFQKKPALRQRGMGRSPRKIPRSRNGQHTLHPPWQHLALDKRRHFVYNRNRPDQDPGDSKEVTI